MRRHSGSLLRRDQPQQHSPKVGARTYAQRMSDRVPRYPRDLLRQVPGLAFLQTVGGVALVAGTVVWALGWVAIGVALVCAGVLCLLAWLIIDAVRPNRTFRYWPEDLAHREA